MKYQGFAHPGNFIDSKITQATEHFLGWNYRIEENVYNLETTGLVSSTK